MRPNGRKVSIFVNENALRAWLSSAPPIVRPTGRPPVARPDDPPARSEEAKTEKS